jgi:hypothetical protein
MPFFDIDHRVSSDSQYWHARAGVSASRLSDEMRAVLWSHDLPRPVTHGVTLSGPGRGHPAGSPSTSVVPVDHEPAVANSRTLFQAARRAGVQWIVHVSITHPGTASPYPYFRGKAMVERALAESGVSYAVLRPAVLFGGDGVLPNNIAWMLRRLPAFGVGATTPTGCGPSTSTTWSGDAWPRRSRPKAA